MTTYSLLEAAQQLGLTDGMKDPQRWLARRIRAGIIPARRTGRSWRLTHAHIEFVRNMIDQPVQEQRRSNVRALSFTDTSARRRAS